VFNVTGGELAIILVVALIVLGPEKLPGAVRKFGQLYGELRRMSNGFQSELREAFDEPTRELRETVELAKSQLMGTFDFNAEADKAEREAKNDGPNFASAAPAETLHDVAAAGAATDGGAADATSGSVTPGPSMQEQTIFEATYRPEAAASNGSSASVAPTNGHPAPDAPVSVAPAPAAVRSPFAPPSGMAPSPGPLEAPTGPPRSPFAPPLPPPPAV
jgi:sec-independent protein translocase protein TatB